MMNMEKKKGKTYSYNEYLDTFYPNRSQEKEVSFDPSIFGDILLEKSVEKLEHSLGQGNSRKPSEKRTSREP